MIDDPDGQGNPNIPGGGGPGSSGRVSKPKDNKLRNTVFAVVGLAILLAVISATT